MHVVVEQRRQAHLDSDDRPGPQEGRRRGRDPTARRGRPPQHGKPHRLRFWPPRGGSARIALVAVEEPGFVHGKTGPRKSGWRKGGLISASAVGPQAVDGVGRPPGPAQAAGPGPSPQGGWRGGPKRQWQGTPTGLAGPARPTDPESTAVLDRQGAGSGGRFSSRTGGAGHGRLFRPRGGGPNRTRGARGRRQGGASTGKGRTFGRRQLHPHQVEGPGAPP